MFQLERLPYVQDGVRLGDDDRAERIGQLIFEAYRECGYGITRVPVMPVADRTKFVLGSLPR